MGARARRKRTPWWRGRFVRWVLLPFLALRLVTYVVIRTHLEPVIDGMRAFNKRVLNPAMLSLAGRRHWYAARVEHVGRRSGHRYATPVVAVPVQGGFAIPLPYGTDVDWLRNVLAAGGATVVNAGERHQVTDPVVMASDLIQPQLSPRWRMATRLYGFSHWLRVSEAA